MLGSPLRSSLGSAQSLSVVVKGVEPVERPTLRVGSCGDDDGTLADLTFREACVVGSTVAGVVSSVRGAAVASH
jgi:hypothetical protein